MEERVGQSLRIFAWNPNGIRALLKNNSAPGNAQGHLDAFIRNERPDIVFFPETKGNRQAQYETQCKLEAVFMKATPTRKWKWYWSYCDRAGRHGNAVAVAKDIVVDQVSDSLRPNGSPESEGRVIALKLYHKSIVRGKGIWLLGLYVPNASTKLSRLDHKVAWLNSLRTLMDAYRNEGNSVIVIGDINVAPDMRDLCNPSGNHQTPGYSEAERSTFAWLMQPALPADDCRTGEGYIDVWRQKHPLPYRTQKHNGVYSFWSTRSKARNRNAGWRIDLVLMDRESYRDGDCVSDVMICPQYYGSDHCPVGVEISLVDFVEIEHNDSSSS